MSTEDVNRALTSFLASEHPQAVALTGAWGRGKTYFWRRAIEAFAATGQFKGKYCYVSLFGIANLEDLKNTVFDNAVSADRVAVGATAETWLMNARAATPDDSDSALNIEGSQKKRWFGRAAQAKDVAVGEGRKNLSALASLPAVKNFAPFLRTAAFLSVRNYVICFDDLERRGRGLDLKEVFGLISFLKEQRACKIIAILNGDELGEDKRPYDAFREKVFDFEISFSPTPKECTAIAFPDAWVHHSYAREAAEKLSITNIRILYRVKSTIEKLMPYMAGCDDLLPKTLITSATLLTWCYNSKEVGTPDYEYVKHYQYGTSIFGDRKKNERTPKEETSEKILSGYGWRHTDEFDLQICHLLENGFILDDDFRAAVAKFNGKVLQDKITGAFEGAWRLFHDTFAENETELVSTIESRFIASAEWITLLNVQGVVGLMRELGRDDVAGGLIAHWVSVQAEKNPGVLDISNFAWAGDIRDVALKNSIAKAQRQHQRVPTLAETVTKSSGKRGWSELDVQVLSQSSSNDYYNFFMSIENDDLYGYVMTCLEFGSFANSPPEYKLIADRAKEALLRIGKSSRLNAMRVRRFGINVNAEAMKGDPNRPQTA